MEQLFLSNLYQGEVVLITGGGTGIGLSVAREVGQLGARVALLGRRREPLEAAAVSLREAGIEVYYDTCDIREPERVRAFVASVCERFEGVTVLVNNAGGQFPAHAEQVSPKGFEAVVRNNLLGTWNMTHAVATLSMLPRREGRIVNVTAQVTRGFPGMVHTGAARSGVENMTKTLSVEWSTYGLRVNAVAPGVIRSTGTAQYPEELIEQCRRATPLKRLGTPEEVAHLITYLGSRAADYITGQTFIIDGGQSLWGDLWELPDA